MQSEGGGGKGLGGWNLYADDGGNLGIIGLRKKKSGTLGVRKTSILKFGPGKGEGSGSVNSDRDVFVGSSGMKSVKKAEKGMDWSLAENGSSRDDEARRIGPKSPRAKNSNAFIKETSFETDGHFLRKVKSIMESMREKSTRKNVEMNIRPSSFLNDSTSLNNQMNHTMKKPVRTQPHNSENPTAVKTQQGSPVVKGTPLFYGYSNNRCKEHPEGSTPNKFFIRIEHRNTT